MLGFRALGFIMCKEDPPNVSRIVFAFESHKWYFNGWLWKME
jgi:hypothetical protein